MTIDIPKTEPIVLIDDDDLIRMGWEVSAEEKGYTLRCFASFAAFVAEQQDLSKNSHVFIDSNLGVETKGEMHIPEIKEFGFENVYLATGNPAEDYLNLSGVKAVIGKMPPWEERQF